MLKTLVQRWAPLLTAQSRILSSLTSLRSFHCLTPPVGSLRSLTPNSQIPMEPIASSLLRPTVPLVEQVAGFKVKGRLRRRCKDCYFVIRQERLYVICKTHPRHKQMAMKQRDYKSWILTHATQSKVRPY
ncbi:39S ribosomal protein L36, mitochondrial [Hermetia illucens]|nr:39S ribosomal protein L36, mitochondrial [Hermetia illucens]